MSHKSIRTRATFGILLMTSVAVLQAPSIALAGDDDGPKDGIPSPSIATSLPGNGDPGGVRKRLSERGLTYGLNYIGEVWGTASGGIKRTTQYADRIEGVVDVDFGKVLALPGLTFHTNFYQIDSQLFSGQAVGSIAPISGVEARSTFRLYELWFERSFAGTGLSVRAGQLAADTEFMISATAGQFVSAAFGWPDILAADLTSGGPAYPLATPGIRVKWEAPSKLTLLAALFNGDPAGPGDRDPQIANRHGTNFRLNDDPLLMVEAQYKVNQEKTDTGLAGTYKIGGFTHFGSFQDQRFDDAGVSRAFGATSGRLLHHNWGAYGVVDQQIWRPKGAGPDQGVSLFTRLAFAPSDRNLVSTYLDGGIVFAGLIASRPDDSFGLAVAWDRISDDARNLDRDVVALGTPQPIRSEQVLLELNYKAQVVPGFYIQPDFQYIWHPGGNIPDPNDSTRAIPNAAVVGVRTTINY